MACRNGCKRVAGQPAADSAAATLKRVKRTWDPLDLSVSPSSAASSAPAVEDSQHAKTVPATVSHKQQQDAVPEGGVMPAPADLPRIAARPPKPSAQHQAVQACTTPTTSDAVNVSFGVWAMSQSHGDGTPSGIASAEGSLQHWAHAVDAADVLGESDRLITPYADMVAWGCSQDNEDCEDTATSSASDDSNSECGSQGDRPSGPLATAASATQQVLLVQLAPGEEESMDSQRPVSAGQAFSFGGLAGPGCLQPYWASASVGVKAK